MGEGRERTKLGTGMGRREVEDGVVGEGSDGAQTCSSLERAGTRDMSGVTEGRGVTGTAEGRRSPRCGSQWRRTGHCRCLFGRGPSLPAGRGGRRLRALIVDGGVPRLPVRRKGRTGVKVPNK